MQFIVGVSRVLENSMTDLKLDVVPQMQPTEQIGFSLSSLLLTANAKNDDSRMSFKLAQLIRSMFEGGVWLYIFMTRINAIMSL